MNNLRLGCALYYVRYLSPIHQGCAVSTPLGFDVVAVVWTRALLVLLHAGSAIFGRI